MSNSRTLSSFTLIVTFVCLALIGLALVPLLPVKLAPSRVLPGSLFHLECRVIHRG